MPSAPFLRPIRKLVAELEHIAADSATHKHQLCILAEICATASRDIEEESNDPEVPYEQPFISKVKVLEHVLTDARDSAVEIASRHFLRILWTREDPAIPIAALFDIILADLQELELAKSVQRGSIATRDTSARAADEAARQNILLAATRDYALLESVLQLDKCSPLVVVSAMQKVRPVS